MGSRLFMALVHYPVYNRRHEVVATAITNLDIHDIARAARAYGVESVLIVTPLERQRWLLERILRHWQAGHGAAAHPNRKDALQEVHAMWALQEALEWVKDRCGQEPITVATSARAFPEAVRYEALREVLMAGRSPVVLLIGTGWGLSDEIIGGASYVLSPIMECAPYNHLSVRSAAAVILDRLFGDRDH
jgi:hypothetical protein